MLRTITRRRSIIETSCDRSWLYVAVLKKKAHWLLKTTGHIVFNAYEKLIKILLCKAKINLRLVENFPVITTYENCLVLYL